MENLTDFFQSIEFHNIDEHYDKLKSILLERTFPLAEAEENGLQQTAFEIYNYYANEKKNFERLADFEQLLKEHQPEIYAKEFHYYAEIRIIHGAFQQDWKGVQVGVEQFIAAPVQHYDEMRKHILTILFYQKTDVITDFTKRTYQTIKESTAFYGEPHRDWSELIMYQKFQKLYEQQQFDPATLATFQKELSEDWDIRLAEEYFEDVVLGLQQSKPLPTTELARRNVGSYISQIGLHFARYMHERGMPFMLSLYLWDKLGAYYGNKHKGNAPIFAFEGRDFETFITRQGGMIMDYRHLSMALLYLSLHLYDFLLTNKIIDQKLYDYFNIVQKAIRYHEISEQQTRLWEYNFVHQWAKPQLISTEKFAEQQADFRSRYLIDEKEAAFSKKYETDFPKTHFAPRLKSWLEQASGGSLLANLNESPQPRPGFRASSSSNKPKKPLDLKPVRTDRKYGRNEFVTVRYANGRTKKTKYKKIEADVKAGKCEIL